MKRFDARGEVMHSFYWHNYGQDHFEVKKVNYKTYVPNPMLNVKPCALIESVTYAWDFFRKVQQQIDVRFEF